MRPQLALTAYPLAPGDVTYPRAWGVIQTPLPQPSSGGTGGLPTMPKVKDTGKRVTHDFEAPFSITARIADFFNGVGFSAKPHGQQQESASNYVESERLHIGRSTLNDGAVPNKVPRFFTPAISSWDGPNSRGFTQFNYRLQMKKPAIPRGNVNARVISGILARPMGAGRQRVPAIYVPTSIT